jgi:hypothetical protein
MVYTTTIVCFTEDVTPLAYVLKDAGARDITSTLTTNDAGEFRAKLTWHTVSKRHSADCLARARGAQVVLSYVGFTGLPEEKEEEA